MWRCCSGSVLHGDAGELVGEARPQRAATVLGDVDELAHTAMLPPAAPLTRSSCSRS